MGRGEAAPAAEPSRLDEAFAALGRWEKPLLALLLLMMLLTLPLLENQLFPEPAAPSPEELAELLEMREQLPRLEVLYRDDPYLWAKELLRHLGCAEFQGLREGETLMEVQQRHRNYLAFLEHFLRPWAQRTAPSDAALLAEQTYLRTLSSTCAREKAALLEQMAAGPLRDARLQLMEEWYRELEQRHQRVNQLVGREPENPTPWDVLFRQFDYQRYWSQNHTLRQPPPPKPPGRRRGP